MKDIIVKSNQLIEAQYKLPLTELRIFLKMTSCVEAEDVDFEEYRFSVREMLSEFGMGEKNHDDLVKAAFSLQERSMKIGRQRGILKIGFVSSVERYDDNGTIGLCFDPKLKPYLLQLKKNFTKYQLDHVKKFRSSYSIRLYELLKQYQSVGKREITIDELRKYLEIPENTAIGVYGKIRAAIIEKARKEIKENSDIYFKYRTAKKGRRVHSLIFTIHKKEEQQKFDLDHPGEKRSEAEKAALRKAAAECWHKEGGPHCATFQYPGSGHPPLCDYCPGRKKK